MFSFHFSIHRFSSRLNSVQKNVSEFMRGVSFNYSSPVFEFCMGIFFEFFVMTISTDFCIILAPFSMGHDIPSSLLSNDLSYGFLPEDFLCLY